MCSVFTGQCFYCPAANVSNFRMLTWGVGAGIFTRTVCTVFRPSTSRARISAILCRRSLSCLDVYAAYYVVRRHSKRGNSPEWTVELEIPTRMPLRAPQSACRALKGLLRGIIAPIAHKGPGQWSLQGDRRGCCQYEKEDRSTLDPSNTLDTEQSGSLCYGRCVLWNPVMCQPGACQLSLAK